jgi:TRAP-type mannitol/chloroaromatic compound transport system permease small subunit
LVESSGALIHKTVNFIYKVNTLIAEILMYATMVLMIVVAYGVIRRYVFGAPDVRTYFVSLWLYGVPFVLGGAYTLIEGAHASVDILYNKLSPRKKLFLSIIDMAVVAASSAIVFLVGVPIAWRSFLIQEVDSSLALIFAPPIWWYKWVAVIGAALLSVQATIEILKRVQRWA